MDNTGLAQEFEQAAEILASCKLTVGFPDEPGELRFPRAVSLLRAKAAALRGKDNPSAGAQGKQGRKRSMKAFVGKRRTKGSAFNLKGDYEPANGKE